MKQTNQAVTTLPQHDALSLSCNRTSALIACAAHCRNSLFHRVSWWRLRRYPMMPPVLYLKARLTRFDQSEQRWNERNQDGGPIARANRMYSSCLFYNSACGKLAWNGLTNQSSGEVKKSRCPSESCDPIAAFHRSVGKAVRAQSASAARGVASATPCFSGNAGRPQMSGYDGATTELVQSV